MEKISTKIINEFKKRKLSNVFNFSEIKLANDILSEINSGIVKRLETGNYDPSHKIYLLVQNLLSYFAEDISILDDFEEYYDTVEEIDAEYMPSFPPMSPLTNSYITLWCFCDFRFGKTKETISTIFYDLGKKYNFDKSVMDAINNFNSSYMGFYKHIGFDNDLIILKEIVSDIEYKCICPAGYVGRKGEIWYVRIIPNLDEVYNYHIIFTTPYIILNYSEKDWKKFFQRQIGNSGNLKIYHFLKYHPDIKYWHNYIFEGYVNYNENCIFLTGIPDIKGSKPFEIENL